MTTEEKILLAVLTITATLVPVALGAALDWPAWSWLLLAVPLLGVLGRVARNIYLRVRYERLSQRYVAPVQLERTDQSPHTPVTDVALPSAVADYDYDFHFSATVYWRPSRGSRAQHANLSDLARIVILDRARMITEVEQPDKIGVVHHRLASELGTVQRDESSGLETWADHVQLTLFEADQERLRKFSEMRKDEDLWEHERNYESRKRDYFRGEVLKSTGSAVIWRLAQKDNDVEDTVRLIGALAQLSAAANDRQVSEPFRHLVPAFESLAGDERFPNGFSQDGITEFSRTGLAAGPFSDIAPVVSQSGALIAAMNLGDELRAHFTHRLARLIEKTGKLDEAHEIRRRFDAPVTDSEPVGLPEPDGDLSDRPAPDVQPPRQPERWRNSPLSGESEHGGQSQADEQFRSEQLGELRD